ncbi:MAG: peptide ligase PGM1-related protein [Spirulinaceae cyanobacterium]
MEKKVMSRSPLPPSVQTKQFKQLQNQLRDRWQSVDVFDQDDYDILVIPSFSIDQHQGEKIPGFLHYEERMLFSLIRLRNPYTRLIYLTALPLSPLIIEYYLQLLPGIPFSHARNRLLLLSADDASFKPLSQKILERPRLVERIRKALRPHKSYMVCFNSTLLEQELSLQLNVPLLASSPDLLYWGSKSGSREIFAQCGIPHPDGTPQVWNSEDLVVAINQLWQRHPHLAKMVVKLNEGFSGEGNALLDLKQIQNYAPKQASQAETSQAITNHLPNLRFQAKGETWSNFQESITKLGAIVEVFIEGEIKRSPSVQGYITPNGEVKILSTHDQILGGVDGQIYLGCSFPADAAYRLQLQTLGAKVGDFLAAKGALERFGVDFVAVQQQDSWEMQAIEINLRKGGTTHPFMALKLLTSGNYDLSTGLFFSQDHQAKYYIATDNLQKESYQGLLPADLMEIIACHRLNFDSSTRTGNVFHLMGALSQYGKLGLISIGNSREEAETIYQEVEEVLDRETQSLNPVAKSSLPITWM